MQAEVNDCGLLASPVAIKAAEVEWKWITAAAVVDAIIVACAIFIPILIPQLRPGMLLGAALAILITAVAVAFLLPPRLCVALGGWVDVSLQVRLFVAGVGLVVALILASFALAPFARKWGSREPDPRPQ